MTDFRLLLTTLTDEIEVYRDSLFWDKDNLDAQDKFISDMKLKVYYKPEYEGDNLIEQPYFYNYYEILDILSMKLLAYDLAKQVIKDRHEIAQEDANNPENVSPKTDDNPVSPESAGTKGEGELLSPAAEQEEGGNQLDNSALIKQMEHDELVSEI